MKISIPSCLISFNVILTRPFSEAIYLSSKSSKAHKIFFNFSIGTLFLKIIFSRTRRKQPKCHHKRFKWMRKRQLSLNYTGDVFFKTFALLSERSWQSSLLNLLPVPGAVWEDMFYEEDEQSTLDAWNRLRGKCYSLWGNPDRGYQELANRQETLDEQRTLSAVLSLCCNDSSTKKPVVFSEHLCQSFSCPLYCEGLKAGFCNASWTFVSWYD